MYIKIACYPCALFKQFVTQSFRIHVDLLISRLLLGKMEDCFFNVFFIIIIFLNAEILCKMCKCLQF